MKILLPPNKTENDVAIDKLGCEVLFFNEVKYLTIGRQWYFSLNRMIKKLFPDKEIIEIYDVFKKDSHSWQIILKFKRNTDEII